MNIKIKHSLLAIFCILSLLIFSSVSYAEPVDTTEEVTETTSAMEEDYVDELPSDDTMVSETSDVESDYSDDTMAESDDTLVIDDESAMAETTDISSDETATGSGLESTTGVYYTVKKGDTLWDLSQRFNNDAWKWPGMWSDNKQLTNPHLIYPGQRLKLFYRKDIELVKQLEEQIEAEEDVETVETTEVIEPEETEKVVEAVEPVKMDETSEAKTDDDAPIELPYYHYSKMDSAGFMKKKPADSHGYIFKVKGIERLMISKGDEVYIKETGDIPLTPGGKYFCYKLMKPSYIKKKLKKQRKILGIKTKKVKKSLIGTQHYLTGVIEITGKKSGYAIGRIIKSYKTISLEDYLIPYVYRSPDVTLASSVEGLSGTVISSEEQEGRFGDDKVAFIDKGTNDGVKRGQMYNVFYPEEKDSSDLIGGDQLFIPVDFASILVIHAEPTTSTVLVTSAYKSISAGDKWHYPQE